MNNIVKQQTKETKIGNQSVKFVLIENQWLTSTTELAKVFNKKHNFVIKNLRSLPNFDELLMSAFLHPLTYTDNKNKEREMFFIDKMVFNLLSASFTDDEAFQYKWDYVQEFEKLRKETEDNKLIEMNEYYSTLVDNSEMSLRKVLQFLNLTDSLSEHRAWEKLEEAGVCDTFYLKVKKRRLLDTTKGSQSSTGRSTILFNPKAIKDILES